MQMWNNKIWINGESVMRFGTNAIEMAHRNNHGQATNYEVSIVQLLDVIGRKQTGNIILEEIIREMEVSGHILIITPYTEHHGNAFTAPLSNADLLFTTPHGRPVRNNDGVVLNYRRDDPRTPQIEHPGNPMIGRGGGGNIRILFNPGDYGHHHFTSAETAGFRPDEILLHELFHARRQMAGQEERVPMGHHFDNQEEFYAVMVTNIYSSECGAMLLRGSHVLPYFMGALGEPGTINDFTPPDFTSIGGRPGTTAAQDFVRRNQALIHDFCSSEPNLSNRIGRVNVHFNPIHEYLITMGSSTRS